MAQEPPAQDLMNYEAMAQDALRMQPVAPGQHRLEGGTRAVGAAGVGQRV